MRVSLAVAAVLVAYGWFGLQRDLGAFLELPPADEDCVVLPGSEAFWGSEDMMVWRDGTVVVTAGDLNIFNKGIDEIQPGRLYAADLRSASPRAREVPLEGFPADVRFQPHGLFVSYPRIYATSHPWFHGSRVEVFEGVEEDGVLVRARWLRSVEHDLLSPRGFPNDVVEGASRNEIYVTRWLIFPIPDGGKDRPFTAASALREAAALLASIFRLRFTRVYRCVFDDDDVRCAAVGEAHVGANGITISDDKATVYVADPVAASVTVYARRSDGALDRVDVVDLPHAIDNINLGPDGELVMGSLPVLKAVVDKAPRVPGTLLVATDGAAPPGLDRRAVGVRGGGDARWTFRDVAVSDGAKVSQISGGVLVGDWALLGSPYARGALLCPRR